MSSPELIYNSPFEHEKWVWRITDSVYTILKYRQIDCDESGGLDYYYDYIILDVLDEENNEIVSLKKYCDEEVIIYLSNPFNALGKNLVEFNKCITAKINVAVFKYFSNNPNETYEYL
jgi:hypothetical protein